MKDLELEDYFTIKETVNLYIAGGILGKSEIMEKAFHEDATIYGWMYPNADDHAEKIKVAGPIQHLYDYVQDIGPAENLKAEFVRVDIHDKVANVKLELFDWQGIQFTDTLNLIKGEGSWRIINKVFSQSM